MQEVVPQFRVPIPLRYAKKGGVLPLLAKCQDLPLAVLRG